MPTYKAFSDFSGGTLSITNPTIGEVVPHRLFVCTFGASNYTYAELFESESAESWCNGQANAFHFFGGVPELITNEFAGDKYLELPNYIREQMSTMLSC